MRLTQKLVLVMALLLVLASVVSTLVNIRAQQETARRRLVDKARAMAALSAEGAAGPLARERIEALELLAENVLRQEEVAFVQVLDAGGRVVAEGGRSAHPELAASGADPRPEPDASGSVALGPDLLEVSAPVAGQGRRLGTVRIGFALDRFHRELADIRDRNLLLGGGFVALGVAASLLLAVRITRPLRQVIAGTHEVARGRLDGRIRVRSGDEIEQLAEAFNAMTSSLEVYRDRFLRAHEELEERVRVRTTALRETNESLERQIRERQSLEDQLRQSQKMEAIGRLAGGVAHDFNNLLTGVIGYARLLLSELDAEHPLRDDVRQILWSGERAAALTEQLLTFSRREPPETELVELDEVVRGMQNLLRGLAGEEIETVFDLHPESGSVEANRTQLEQVVLNLALNARDAMPAGGLLRIRTARVELEEGAPETATLAPGSYALLEVSDTGEGMSPATLSMAFEPFFTTKEVGQGSGLGLATVYAICQQGGGHVQAQSEEGKGTRFRVLLPRAASDLAPRAGRRPDGPLPGGRETVLLAEDEEVVRRLARHCLEPQGYTVLEARDGDEALRLAAEHSGPIDLLLSDVVMPGRSGPDLARALADRRPGIRVLFLSGYPHDLLARHGVERDRRLLLRKPFDPESLVRRVREILDAPLP